MAASNKRGKRGGKAEHAESFSDLVLATMDLSIKVRDCCRAFNTHAIHAPDVNQFAKCIRSCSELIEVTELVMFFINNRSENIKPALALAITVVKSTLLECKPLESNEYNQQTVELCAEQFRLYQHALTGLHRMV